MPEKTMRDAINEALHQAMEQDDSVFVIGEDVAGCSGSAGDVGAVGGVCLLYTSPSPRDLSTSRMPSSA